MTLRAGDTVALRMARELPPYGVLLTDGNRNVLLHRSQMTGEVRAGEDVTVFLYHDSEDRLAATMKPVNIRWGRPAALPVVDVRRRLGCFLDMGLDRHLLLPEDELPESAELRPQVGDAVYVRLDRDKQGRLLARLAGERELAPECVAAPQHWKNRRVEAIVYRPLSIGSFVVCDAGVLGFGVLGFIHASERTRPLRLGERLEARVTFVRADGRVNLSMRKAKEEGREEDAERILGFLRSRPGGTMPYSDDTPPEIIREKFGISKSAFKRALGKLMKEGLVIQDGGWTSLRNGRPSERE